MIEKFAKLFRVLNYASLVLLWIYTIVTYFQLPDIIPIHFGVSGEADGFGNKKMNFFLAGISTAMFFLLQYCSKHPYTPGLNIPDSLRANKPLTELFCQVLCFIMMLLFLDISYETTQVALKHQSGISYITLYFIVFMFIVMLIFFWYAKKYPVQKF